MATLAPAMQREVNAALLARNLVPQAGRHDVLDLLRDLLTVLFEDGGALLRSWPPQMDVRAWGAQLAAAQSAAVLDQAAPLPPERAPDPETIAAWWQAASEDPARLPVPPEQRAHAAALLRPLLAHEAHALAAEVLGAAQAGLRGPDAALDPILPGPSTSGSLDTPTAPPPRPRANRRGLLAAAGLAVVIIGAAVFDRLTSNPLEDLTPTFALKARRGHGATPPVYMLGDGIRVVLRPNEDVTWSARTESGGPLLLGVDVWARDEARRPYAWRPTVARSADGDLTLTGIVGKDLPVYPGDWELFFLIGPREDLDRVGVAEALAAEPPAPPVRRVRYRIRVVDPQLLPMSETATSS